MKPVSFTLLISLLASKFHGIIGEGWDTITWDNFDHGWKHFKDGGNDAKRGKKGGWIRLRHNTESSTMTHIKEYDVTKYSELRVEFKFCASRMEGKDGFSLQIQEDGSSWVSLKKWTSGKDFSRGNSCFTKKDTDKVVAISIEETKVWKFSPTAGTISVRIRFKCEASKANESVYIDDVLFQGFKAATTKEVGKWGNFFRMKVICIHAIVYSKDHLLCYGTDEKGIQRADRVYEVFDFSQGTEEKYHYQINTFQDAPDIFCSDVAWDYTTGNLLITGGDKRDEGENLGITTVLEFDTETHKLDFHPKGDMHYARWYGASVNLPDGRVFVIGGLSEEAKNGTIIPEVWSPQREKGFKQLPGAKIMNMRKDWWYPHSFVNSRGEIIVIMPRYKEIYRVDVDGQTGQEAGSITPIGQKTFQTHDRSPSIMYRIDEVAMIDRKGILWTANIAAKNPKFQSRANIGSARLSGGFCLLADGTLLISGGGKLGKGSSAAQKTGNDLSLADMDVLLWDPDSDKIRKGPNQALARLYHGNILLLPDGRCLSSGGGAPGPLSNLNGQLYSPPYLFGENNQQALLRPQIKKCPVKSKPRDDFLVEVDDANAVKRVTVVRSGAFTHARNVDTRWIELDYKKTNNKTLQVYPRQVVSQAQNSATPVVINENVMIPGLWMIFTINEQGITSKGCVFTVVVK